MPNRNDFFLSLLADKNDNPNRVWLAQIIASWLNGESVLPDYLGLEPAQFTALQQTYFSHYPLPAFAPSGHVLDYERMLEKEDLIDLLKTFSIDQSASVCLFRQ